jgi:hypothetical protein
MAVVVVAFALVLLTVVFVVVMWPLSLSGHALGLTPSFDQLLNRDRGWMHDHYPLVGLRYVGAALLLASPVIWFVQVVRRALDVRRRRRPAALAHAIVREMPNAERIEVYDDNVRILTADDDDEHVWVRYRLSAEAQQFLGGDFAELLDRELPLRLLAPPGEED